VPLDLNLVINQDIGPSTTQRTIPRHVLVKHKYNECVVSLYRSDFYVPAITVYLVQLSLFV
jgi:hypothetical protein